MFRVSYVNISLLSVPLLLGSHQFLSFLLSDSARAIEDIVTVFECDCLIEFPFRAKTINTLDGSEKNTKNINSEASI